MNRTIGFCAVLLTASSLWPLAGQAQLAASQTITLAQPTGKPPAVCTPVAPTAATTTVTLNRAFYDDFSEGLKLSNATTPATWTPHYDGGYNPATGADPAYAWPAFSKRTIPGNNEQQVYVDPGYKGTSTKALGLNPFIYDSATKSLAITANKMPSSLAQYLKIGPNGTINPGYYSGVITTRDSFSQLFGYFEVRAQLPAGNHLWPAVWLVATDHTQWPPEIDILEMPGQTPNKYATTIWYKTATGAITHSGCYTSFPTPVSNDFHIFGALWTSERITYYFDRQPIIDVATPSTMQTMPMYMMINLAVGGTMVGVADSTTPMPSALKINWATAYSIAK